MSFPRQSVFEYNTSNLFHLVGFALPTLRLQIQDFLHASAIEDVVTAADSFLEAQAGKQLKSLKYSGGIAT